jgi:hypothetical protein
MYEEERNSKLSRAAKGVLQGSTGKVSDEQILNYYAGGKGSYKNSSDKRNNDRVSTMMVTMSCLHNIGKRRGCTGLIRVVPGWREHSMCAVCWRIGFPFGLILAILGS